MKNSRSPPIGKSKVMLKYLPVPKCDILPWHFQNITSMPFNNCTWFCGILIPDASNCYHWGNYPTLESWKIIDSNVCFGKEKSDHSPGGYTPQSSLASNSPLSMNQKTCFEDSKPCLQPSPFRNRFLRANKHDITKKDPWVSWYM